MRGAGGESNEGRESQEMTALFVKLQTFCNRDEGQGLVEYSLILVLVSIFAIAALTILGGKIDTVLRTVSNALDVP
jgi:Flp pilus assembly pilin Flp